jgi:hypothetical protein
MSLDRRDFLKASLAASASAALATQLAAEAPSDAVADAREFYELRCYHVKADTRIKVDANPALVDAYLEKAVLPALTARGLKNIGVFTELDVNKETNTGTPKAGSPFWMLIPHPSLASFVAVSGDLLNDAKVVKAGHDYLEPAKTSPSFERIDSWLLRAFKGIPTLELPAFSKNKVPTRVFEMRDYESFSELKALNKMAMFDDAEIQLMRDLGMSPVFFGQALAGKNLPHLRYITSGPDLATHFAKWGKFGTDPRWVAMRDDPKFADNVSQNTARFLAPRSYSQI